MKYFKLIIGALICTFHNLVAQKVTISDSVKISILPQTRVEVPLLCLKNDTIFKRNYKDLKLVKGIGVLSDTSGNSLLINEGFIEENNIKIKLPFYNSDSNTKGNWDEINKYPNNPSIRSGHVGAYIGGKFVVWGSGSGLNTGGIFNLQNQTWQSTSMINAPTANYNNGYFIPLHAFVVGGKVIIWSENANDSRILDVNLNQWSNISPVGAFVNTGVNYNYGATACGNELIFFTFDNNGSYGKKYNILTNQWSDISQVNIPSPRFDYSSVWTGTEMIVWGGQAPSTYGLLNTGAKYNPQTDTWTSISTINTPSARYRHSAIYTGSEMIIYGGSDISGLVNTGAKYNPLTDAWQNISGQNSPQPRYGPMIAWSGSDMIVWGCNWSNNSSNECQSGALYNPSDDTWKNISTFYSPPARTNSLGLWTGNAFLIWGGRAIPSNLDLNDFYSLIPGINGLKFDSNKEFYLYKKQ